MNGTPSQADASPVATIQGERPGFRLDHLELFNWGTFDERIWHLHTGGSTSLLTGDIGSGKSTLVDAITTLLVPPGRAFYNKAAGADTRERSARSYVLGYYKAEKSETGVGGKPVGLRDANSYSVVLARFYNQGYDQHVTVAQVFWMKDAEGQPSRLFVVAERALSIADHFSQVAGIAELRKRLRSLTKDVHESFPPYQSALRRRLGIENEQALELFHQTVSMKSVGNLTDFVRQHMLQPFPVEDRIDKLIAHVDDLTRAHDAVLRAKDQLSRLVPIITECDEYDAIVASVRDLRGCRGALGPFMAARKLDLVRRTIAELDRQHRGLSFDAEQLDIEGTALAAERDGIKTDVALNGGDAITRRKHELAQTEQRQRECSRRATTYSDQAAAAGLHALTDASSFIANRETVRQEVPLLEAELGRLKSAELEQSSKLNVLSERHRELAEEVASLRRRPSNIPGHFVGLRNRLCAELAIEEGELPFAGELLRVRDDERAWEGAIERALAGVGLSLMVSDAHYPAVSQWVDRTNLRQRLVYLRPTKASRARAAPLQSLSRKIVVKHDSPFAEWLQAELVEKHDLVCCETLEQFRREKYALTRAGQIKKGEQHVKDDRYDINDRTRYVLGWSNVEKIAALLAEQDKVVVLAQECGAELAAVVESKQRTESRLGAMRIVAAFTDFSDVDWRSLESEANRLGAEIAAIEASSNNLATLQEQLKDVELRIEKCTAKAKDVGGRMARLEERRHTQVRVETAAAGTVASTSEGERSFFVQLDELEKGAGLPTMETSEDCDRAELRFREWLQVRIDGESQRATRTRDRAHRLMSEYRNLYPAETRETDASVDAAVEYRRMLDAVRTDDLPRFEKRFKELLNENTIREVANFQSQLNREQHDIRERVETINRSLREIEFNPARYIVLEAARSVDDEVRTFAQDLKACLEGTLTGTEDEAYSEAKFLQVKKIIERFRGRDEFSDIDRRWRMKVTDVRNWFSFSATERWTHDDTEYEHYSDSGGKSGGQKEKLAYTVLAASLAYQFGLELGETRSRSFRFVVIDEAFGRGSDESAAFALELFRKLDLQLLVVTPLQKIHVIEPYVWNVGFVYNPDGERSKVRNLTIEQYRLEKAQRGQ